MKEISDDYARGFVEGLMIPDCAIRPMCLYTNKDIALFHQQTRATQEAWNAYCQREADAWNDSVSYDKTTNLYHQWRPDLSLKEWILRAV